MREFLSYFLRLGTFGFGGPIALAGHMQHDLVEKRRWISRQDYIEGLALSQLSPGPLAAQLAMYLGWVRAGRIGSTLVAAAFILPSLVMGLGLSGVYCAFGELWRIAWYFTEAGAFVFGSGLAIVPFLHGGVVDEFHWLKADLCADAARARSSSCGSRLVPLDHCLGFREDEHVGPSRPQPSQ